MSNTITLQPLILLVAALSLLHAGMGSAADAAPSGSGTVQHQTKNDTLGLLLSNIASNAPATGFYMAAAGEGAGQLFALGLCRADLTAGRCRGCLVDLRSGLLLYSFNATSQTAWLNFDCFMRYSTRSFFGVADLRGSHSRACARKGTPREADDYEAGIRLVKRLADQAPTRPLMFAFARAGESLSYGLVQCTRDLSSGDCSTCLSRGIDDLATFCKQSGGGHYASDNCIVAYDDAAFFNTSMAGVVYPPAPAPAPAPAHDDAAFFNTSMAGVVYPPAPAPAHNNNNNNNIDNNNNSDKRQPGLTGVLLFLLLVINLFHGW